MKFNLTFSKQDQLWLKPIMPEQPIKCEYPDCNKDACVALLNTTKIEKNGPKWRSLYLFVVHRNDGLMTCQKHKAKLPKENEV